MFEERGGKGWKIYSMIQQKFVEDIPFGKIAKEAASNNFTGNFKKTENTVG